MRIFEFRNRIRIFETNTNIRISVDILRMNGQNLTKFCIHIIQGSRGRRIRRPGTKKIGLGRMVLLRDDSTDARFFRREASRNDFY